jgi:hypothetical protein
MEIHGLRVADIRGVATSGGCGCRKQRVCKSGGPLGVMGVQRIGGSRSRGAVDVRPCFDDCPAITAEHAGHIGDRGEGGKGIERRSGTSKLTMGELCCFTPRGGGRRAEERREVEGEQAASRGRSASELEGKMHGVGEESEWNRAASVPSVLTRGVETARERRSAAGGRGAEGGGVQLEGGWMAASPGGDGRGGGPRTAR